MTEHQWVRGRETTRCRIQSSLQLSAVSTESYMDLELTSCEIMAQTEVGPLTN